MKPQHHQIQQIIPTFWIIWCSILIGTFFIQWALEGGIPEGSDHHSHPPIIFIVCLACLSFSTTIRWVIIPRVRTIDQLLMVFLIGISLNEATSILSILTIEPSYPQSKRIIFLLCILSTIQFIPTFIKKSLKPPAR